MDQFPHDDQPTEEIFESFDSRVSPEPMTGCWIWTGNVNALGYGRFWVEGGLEYAHRCSWELHRGQIPDGANVLHRCDQPHCVNPDHLFLGSQADNMEDMRRKGRARNSQMQQTHCHQGHRLDGENVATWGDRRHCLECRRSR